MRLPIRSIDFDEPGQALLHEKIADLVDAVLTDAQNSFVVRDEQIEHAVRTLYGVASYEMSQRIDTELQRISAYGPLLGRKRPARAFSSDTSA